MEKSNTMGTTLSQTNSINKEENKDSYYINYNTLYNVNWSYLMPLNELVTLVSSNDQYCKVSLTQLDELKRLHQKLKSERDLFQTKWINNSTNDNHPLKQIYETALDYINNHKFYSATVSHRRILQNQLYSQLNKFESVEDLLSVYFNVSDEFIQNFNFSIKTLKQGFRRLHKQSKMENSEENKMNHLEPNVNQTTSEYKELNHNPIPSKFLVLWDLLGFPRSRFLDHSISQAIPFLFDLNRGMNYAQSLLCTFQNSEFHQSKIVQMLIPHNSVFQYILDLELTCFENSKTFESYLSKLIRSESFLFKFLSDYMLGDSFKLQDNGKILIKTELKTWLEFFLSTGVDIEALPVKNNITTSLLIVACHYNRSNIFVNWLIEYGVNINKSNVNGNTPLHIAIAKGKAGIISSLVSKEVNLWKINLKGKDPCFYLTLFGKRKKPLLSQSINRYRNSMKLIILEELPFIVKDVVNIINDYVLYI